MNLFLCRFGKFGWPIDKSLEPNYYQSSLAGPERMPYFLFKLLFFYYFFFIKIIFCFKRVTWIVDNIPFIKFSFFCGGKVSDNLASLTKSLRYFSIILGFWRLWMMFMTAEKVDSIKFRSLVAKSSLIEFFIRVFMMFSTWFTKKSVLKDYSETSILHYL